MAQFNPVLKPYKHQAKALGLLRTASTFALQMGMRTGKTKVTIDDWAQKYMDGDAKDLVIIAPAGVYETWLVELRKHLPDFLYNSLHIAMWRSGAKKSDREKFEAEVSYEGPEPRVLIVNVEAFSTDTGAMEYFADVVDSGRCYIGVDESTIIKNHKAKRTEAIIQIAWRSKYRRILTGLMTPRSPLDTFAQFYFLDPAILGYKHDRQWDQKDPRNFRRQIRQNYRKFLFKYAVLRRIKVGLREVEIVVGYKNLDELAALCQAHSFRIRLEDCADIPKKVYLFRYVDLTPEQVKHYNDLKKKATTEISKDVHATAAEMVTKILRLHQVCLGHLTDEEGVLHRIPTNRLKELMGLLEEYEGKAIVWCSYDHDVREVSDALEKKYGDGSVARFWGGNKATRETDNVRFKTDPACLYMVATPGAGGRGRTWDEADLLVYYSNTDNLEHRDQSEERGSAVAKERAVTVVDSITKGTVEPKIVQNLRSKIDLAAVISGDKWREWLI